MFVWRLHYALLKGAFCYAEVKGSVEVRETAHVPTAQRFCPTAIPFGSAARRCIWENGIFCYQMTVRIEVLFAETL